MHLSQPVSKELCLEGGLAESPGASTSPTGSQPGLSHCNNTTDPGYTLPHLFSQHACEVGRGRDCPRFTEEEVEAHRGQVTCPRSQTAAKLEWGPRAGPQFPRGPCSKCRPRGCLQCHRLYMAQSSPRALSSLRAGPCTPPALPQPCRLGHCSLGLMTPWEWGCGAGERER